MAERRGWPSPPDGRRPPACRLVAPQCSTAYRQICRFRSCLREPVEHRRLKAPRRSARSGGLEVPHHHGVAHDDRADVGALLPFVLRGHVEDIGQEDPVHALFGPGPAHGRGPAWPGSRWCPTPRTAVRSHTACGCWDGRTSPGYPRARKKVLQKGMLSQNSSTRGRPTVCALLLPHRGHRIGLEQQLLPQPEQVRHLPGSYDRLAAGPPSPTAPRSHRLPVT